MPTLPETHEPFSRQGHWHAVENAVVDHVMPALTPGAFKVLSVLIRHTRGFHREQVTFTIRELATLCGMDKDAVSRALKVLTSPLDRLPGLTKGALVLKGREAVTQATTYALNRGFQMREDLLPKRLPDPPQRRE